MPWGAPVSRANCLDKLLSSSSIDAFLPEVIKFSKLEKVGPIPINFIYFPHEVMPDRVKCLTLI